MRSACAARCSRRHESQGSGRAAGIRTLARTDGLSSPRGIQRATDRNCMSGRPRLLHPVRDGDRARVPRRDDARRAAWPQLVPLALLDRLAGETGRRRLVNRPGLRPSLHSLTRDCRVAGPVARATTPVPRSRGGPKAASRDRGTGQRRAAAGSAALSRRPRCRPDALSRDARDSLEGQRE